MLTSQEIEAIAERVADIVAKRGRRAFSINEAATELGLSRSALYVLLENAEVRSFHIGKRRFVPREEIDRFISARSNAPKPTR